MLTKAIDLAARLKRPLPLPLTPEDERRAIAQVAAATG
jgi:hypothetical protein